MVNDRLPGADPVGRRRPAGVHGRADPDGGRPGAGRPGVHAARVARPRLRRRGDLQGQPGRPGGRADQVLLFTDLANPTSNALYQRLGYEPVEDRAIWSFRRHRRVVLRRLAGVAGPDEVFVAGL